MCRDSVNVIISDWQILFREGIHFAISSEEDLTITGEAVLNTEVLKMVESTAPDLVILNNKADELSGIETALILKRKYPKLFIIITSDEYNDDGIFNAIKIGVHGCIWKDNTPEEVLKVVRSTCRGSFPAAALLLKSGIASRTLKEFESHFIEDEILADFQAVLTQPEMNLLRYAVEGKPQITDEQSDEHSYENIARHLESIRFKLVENQRHYEIFKAAQSQLSSLEDTTIEKEPENFITKDEFNTFRIGLEQLLAKLQNNTISINK